ncbi:MAG: Vancomycin B-type resistance protein VanW [Pelotomaculum sp. PtaU1.Bin035]|nr:MAG: Vancomycin B-type resistance protein VanW [Pelotomaculum sp. PtaU1.Bin035]
MVVSVKGTRFIYCFIIVAIITPMVLFGSGFWGPASEKVLPGVEIMGTGLQGLNKSEGMAKLAELKKELRASRIKLHYQDKSWPLLLNEVGFDLDEEAVMDAALNVGRNGSLLQRWRERKELKQNGKAILPVIEFDQEKLAQKVKELTRDITVEPSNANFKISDNDTVTVIPGQDGTGVDMEKLNKDLVSVLLEANNPEVTLSLVTVPPARSTALLESMNINGLLAGYFTRFDPAKVSRTYNISVAARALDEQLVRPGHEVSFNKVVGPRSSEAGYKNAPVIINNEFVDGPGGGVCQVSTTLYNCILLANLEVVERSNHSLPVGYVQIGRDATVVYDAIDLKFRNNTESYIYIKSFVSGGLLGFKIYGNTAYKRDVAVNTRVIQELEPEVVYENDPNLLKGEQVVKQEGSKGFKVSAERVVSLNGVVEGRESLPPSDYNPVNKIIAVGTMEQALPQIAPSTLIPPAGRPNKTSINHQENQSNSGQASGSAPGGSNGGASGETGSGGLNPVNPLVPAIKLINPGGVVPENNAKSSAGTTSGQSSGPVPDSFQNR